MMKNIINFLHWKEINRHYLWVTDKVIVKFLNSNNLYVLLRTMYLILQTFGGPWV